MKYELNAKVWRGPTDVILHEKQTVNELTEAFNEQRRWFTWWEEKGQHEPKRIGWTKIELTIDRIVG